MNKKILLLFILSICGLLFSGYLSGIKFFTETCAFNEVCPYFFRLPACYYGFVMFLVLSISSAILLIGREVKLRAINTVLAVSLLGILFAGYFTLQEIPILFAKGFSAYILGLPTCAMGLVFYILILLSGLWIRK